MSFKPAPKPPKGNTVTRAAVGHPAVPKSKQSSNPAGLPDGLLQAFPHAPGTNKPFPPPPSSAMTTKPAKAKPAAKSPKRKD